jgi:hypothetical protein
LHHPNQNSKYLKLLTNINKVCYIAEYLCWYIYTHTHIFVCSVVWFSWHRKVIHLVCVCAVKSFFFFVYFPGTWKTWEKGWPFWCLISSFNYLIWLRWWNSKIIQPICLGSEHNSGFKKLT